jgi:hypothetical protein
MKREEMLPRCRENSGHRALRAPQQFLRHMCEELAGLRERCVKVFNSSVENHVEMTALQIEIARQG